VASFAGKANSISTIFTLDIYKKFIRKDAGELQMVTVGRVVIILASGIALFIAPQLHSLEQGFQFIQEFTGFISPGVTAIFLMGMFWKGSTGHAALIAAIITIPLSMGFKLLTPDCLFLDRMGYVFIILCLLIYFLSLLEGGGKPTKRSLNTSSKDFAIDYGFAIGCIMVLGLLAGLYILFW